jgi:protoheme IX farnesyltransferase
MVGYSLALFAVSLAPSALGWASGVYLLGAVVLGLGFLACALGFLHTRSAAQARRVLRASLFYLPALFAVLLVDGMLR